MQTTFTHHGFGLGFRPCHYQRILNERPAAIDWLEVISENFMNVGGKPRRILEQARNHYRIAIHGVGLSIGSPEPIPTHYLKQLKELIDWLDPILVSDHLCFTSLGRHNSHDLLPVPYTQAILDRIAHRIDAIQEQLGRRFMLENPSAYVAYADQEMSEHQFLASLVQRTGCGLLLDLNNLYVNQMNLGLDPLAYLEHLPRNCVGQMHLAGHSVEQTDLGTVRIDTHDHAIEETVWQLYRRAIRKWPEASVMIEWDDHIPELDELITGLDRARQLYRDQTPIGQTPQEQGQSIEQTSSSANTNTNSNSVAPSLPTLFAMAVDPAGISDHDPRVAVLSDQTPVPARLGMRVYNNAYFARLRDVLRDEFPTLAGVTTEEAFTAIAADYLRAHRPHEASVSFLGDQLPSFIAEADLSGFDFGVDASALAAMAQLDLARSKAFLHPSRSHAIAIAILSELSADDWERVCFEFTPTLAFVTSTHNIAPVWESIHRAEAPKLPEMQTQYLRVWRSDEIVQHRSMPEDEYLFLKDLAGGQTFAKTAQVFAEQTKVSLEIATQTAIPWLAQWFAQELVVGIHLKSEEQST